MSKLGLFTAATLGSTVLGTGAMYGLDRLANGSMEDQMRRQMELQKKMEMEQMGGMMDPETGMPMMEPQRRSRAETMEEQAMSKAMMDFSRSRDRTRRAKMYGESLLGDLIQEETARIAALQSPRRITPMEAIAMARGMSIA